MRAVLLDSPGPTSEPHWSSAFVDELGAALGAAGVAVRRLRASDTTAAPLHRVAAGLADLPLEIALTKALRVDPADVVVHAGVGGRGSPNLLWIGARMGSAGIAVVRAAEIVCQRGDLVDRDREACRRIDDPERCAWCCRESFWRRPAADDFRTRLDLLIAGLQASSAVWLADDDYPELLERTGVPRRLIRAAPGSELVAAVAEGLRAISASGSAS